MNIRGSLVKKWIRVIWIPCILILFVVSVFLLTRPNHKDLFREPTPNGYHDFLKAVEVGAFDNRVFESDEPSIRAVVEENQEAIHHVLAGLGKNCQVRFEPDHQKHADAISGLSKLIWVLIRRAQILEMKGRVDESLNSYLEAYRFAHESSRGGIFTDRLSSSRMKIKVMREVLSIIPKLSPVGANEFLQLIDMVESDEENSLEKVMIRDECWKDAAYGYSWRMDRVKFYVNRVIRERSLSSLSMLFSDLGSYHNKYLSDYLEPVKVMLKKQAAGVTTLP